MTDRNVFPTLLLQEQKSQAKKHAQNLREINTNPEAQMKHDQHRQLVRESKAFYDMRRREAQKPKVKRHRRR